MLSELTPPQQVTLRGYIASLRTEIKDLETELLTKSDPDPLAHYHGHEKCTNDHGHKGHEHDHGHGDGKACTLDHDHAGHDSHGKEHKHEGHHEHSHDHHAHQNKGHKHDHHGNHDKEQHHSHEHHATEEDMPAWKKKAIESGASDPTVAPFGGNWNSETEISAKDDKMEE